jgi:folate-dependent phosphoribosylglycinamide formyltransferase PurN
MSETNNLGEAAARPAALRVAVLTRAGRPSGAAMAHAVVRGGHTLAGVLAERRRTMILRRLRRMTWRDTWDMFGIDFLLERWRGHPGRSWPELRKTAREAGADYREVNSLNAPESAAVLRDWDADVLVVANAPLLRSEIFTTCRLGAFNFHSGRLPDYGGVASEFWAMYDGEPSAWATLHRITVALDAGEIHAEWEVPIGPDDTPESVHGKCIAAAAEALPGVLERLAAGQDVALRDPGPARIRPWPTAAQRRELRLRRRRSRVT